MEQSQWPTYCYLIFQQEEKKKQERVVYRQEMSFDMAEQKNNETMELALRPAITKLWEERHLSSDLILKARDRETIPVHRSILASRNPVFMKLFYGGFSMNPNSIQDRA